MSEGKGIIDRRFVAYLDDDDEITVFHIDDTPERAFYGLIHGSELRAYFDNNPSILEVEVEVAHAIKPYTDDPEHWSFRVGKMIATRTVSSLWT